jgi:predicted RNase H-like HicB family nuclease
MELNDYLSLPYTITLRRDDEGDWIARVQELSGCTAHGSTEAEALGRLAEAKHEWLTAALEDHVSIPLPDEPDQLPSGKWVQRVPRSLHQRLTRLAKVEGTSLNQLVTSILSQYAGEAYMRASTIGGTTIRGLTTHWTVRAAAGWSFFWPGAHFIHGAANEENITREKVG